MNLRVATFNIRGLKSNTDKRKVLREMLSVNKIDILLQETHIQDFNQAILF